MILAFCYKCSLRITHPSAKPPPRPRLPHRQTRRADPLFPRSPPPRPSCEVRYCFRVLGICPTQLNTAQHSWLVASGLCTVCSQRTPKNLRNLRDFRFLRDNCSAVQCSASGKFCSSGVARQTFQTSPIPGAPSRPRLARTATWHFRRPIPARLRPIHETHAKSSPKVAQSLDQWDPADRATP